MRHNISDIKNVIEDRRMIRPEFFSSRKVHKEIIMELLDAAKWAPTHRYTQPWSFNVFMGEGRKKLADFQSFLYEAVTPNEKFKEEKLEKLQNRPVNVSAVIGIGMKRDEAERDPEVEEIASVAIAVHNMCLVATAHGIGTFWTSGGVTYRPETLGFLGLSEKDKCLGFLYLGYPEGEWPRKTRRKPQEYFTNWIED